jgi:pyridoxal phosphate phosphatase PHOSPHO2
MQVLIDHILREAGLRDAISEIYTNPAQFDDDGCLRLNPYHHQDWCSLSTENLCKGRILDHHRRYKFPADFDRVFYIGDGTNDMCPALRLQPSDIVFARRGFKLAKAIDSSATCEDGQVKARVVLWDTGNDILNTLKDELIKLDCLA